MTAARPGPTQPVEISTDDTARRPPELDRYRSSPAAWASVGLSLLAVVITTAATTAGPRAGLVAAALLLGPPLGGTLLLATICWAADRAHTTRHHTQARARAGLGPVDPGVVHNQALDRLAHRLTQE